MSNKLRKIGGSLVHLASSAAHSAPPSESPSSPEQPGAMGAPGRKSSEAPALGELFGVPDAIQARLAVAVPRGEVFAACTPIVHVDLACLVMTNQALYMAARSEGEVQRIALASVFRVCVPAEQPRSLCVWHFAANQLAAPTTFVFEADDDCLLWEGLVLHQRLMLTQHEAETKVVTSPSVFQAAFPLYKVNRKGVQQERTLVLSDTHVYNVECRSWPLDVKGTKWGVQLGDIKGVGWKEGSLDIVIQTNPHSNSKSKERYEFKCLDEMERNELLHELRRVYLWRCKDDLKEFEGEVEVAQ